MAGVQQSLVPGFTLQGAATRHVRAEFAAPNVQRSGISTTRASVQGSLFARNDARSSRRYDVAGLVVQREILDGFLDKSLPTTLRSKFGFLFEITVFLGLLRDRLRRSRFPLEAVCMLRLFHDQLVADVLYRHARMQMLARMFRARRSPAATSRQERMSALADWQSEKARRAEEMAFLDRPIRRRIVPNGPTDAETQALVKKVLDELTDETLAKLQLD